MDSSSQTTFSDYYRRSPYGRFVRDSRQLEDRSVSFTSIEQPRGAYPDPPLPFLTIGVFRRASATLMGNLGAGRFRGPVQRGAIIVTPLNSATNMVVEGAHSVLVTGLPPSVIQPLMPDWPDSTLDFGRLHSSILHNSLVEQLCLQLWSQADMGNRNSRLVVDGALMTLLGCLRAFDLKQRMALASGRTERVAHWRIHRGAEYLRARMNTNTSLAEVAAVAGLSAFHFARQFKRVFGVPPHHYALQCRIEHARHLLATTRVPILTIALDLGFCTAEHFANTFRGLVGVSPRSYRNACTGQQSEA